MGGSHSTPSQNAMLLGLDGAGKTAILARLLRDDPRTVLPTLGFTVRPFQLAGSQHVLKLWDLGGNVSVRGYWPHYYARADCIVFVIDSTDRRRLAETSACLQGVLDDEALLGLPLLVLANKQDAPAAIPASELEELLHLGRIRDRGWRCVACSALSGKGIDAGLGWLVQVHAPRSVHRSAAELGSPQAGSATVRSAAATSAAAQKWRRRAGPREGSEQEGDDDSAMTPSSRQRDGDASKSPNGARKRLAFKKPKGDAESATAKPKTRSRAERRAAAAAATVERDSGSEDEDSR
jgi:small GTP-binding protein